MKVIASKVATEPLKVKSINEEIDLDFKGGTPAFILEDASILLFETTSNFNNFKYDSSFYNEIDHEVDIKALEYKYIKEDDIDCDQYRYYNKPIEVITVYKLNDYFMYRVHIDNDV